MIQMVASALISLLERELMTLEKDAQDFAIKELNHFAEMLFKYAKEKIEDKPNT